MAIIPKRLETRVLEECSQNTGKKEDESLLHEKLVKYEQENSLLKQRIQYLEKVVQELSEEKQNRLFSEAKTDEIRKRRMESCLKTRKSSKSLRNELVSKSRQFQRQTETKISLNKQTNKSKPKTRRKHASSSVSVSPIPCNIVSKIHDTERELQEADYQYRQLLHKSQAEAGDLVKMHKQLQLLANQIKSKGAILNKLRNKI